MWDFLASSVHTLLCNPVCPGQFCALPSECLALWQRQQLNVFVLHASSVVDYAWCPGQPVNLSCHCWKPCTVSACFHGITHTSYNFTNWQWIFTGATHKNQNTLHTSKSAMVPADHPSLIWQTYGTHSYLYNDTFYMCRIHAYICSPMILLHVRHYFLKLTCVPVRGRKLKIWYKEHIHNRQYKICYSFWTIIMQLMNWWGKRNNLVL